MHWSKNKKIISLIILGIIIHPVLNLNKANASSINSTYNYSIKSRQLVNDINNSSNIGTNLYVEGTIVSISENYITIKDESGQGILFLDTSLSQELKVDDFIFATGEIILKDETNVLLINNTLNIGLVENNKDDGAIEDDENNKDDDVIEDDEDNKGEENGGEDQDEVINGSNSKPTTGNQNQGSSSTIKPGTTISTQVNIESQSTQQTSSTKTYSSRTPISISYDLSESQWDSVTSALKEGTIKVKDIENNKIRITKVSQKYGDKIWIVNDPRMLDKENEEIVTIGVDILESINSSDYDVTQTKWNKYAEDIKEGTAKLKILADETLKIIYSNNNSKDYTISIKKLI